MKRLTKPQHKTICGKLFLLFIVTFLPLQSSADIRKKTFPSKKNSTISVYLGGNYKSDYNSKDYILNFGSLYKDQQFMHELKLYNKVTESHTKTKPMRKTKELYLVEVSNKVILRKTKNYLNLYNLFEQDKYDNFTSSEKLVYNSNEEGFYSRLTSLIGLGRIFSKNFEAELNVGWVHSRGEGGEMAINPALYLKKNINKNLKISTKISRVKQQKMQDDYFNFSVTQKINKDWAMSIYNIYKKTQYIYRKQNSKTNIREVRKRSQRSMTLNLRYYL